MMKEIITTTLILFYTGVLIGQDPFNCTEEAYLFQTNDIYTINLATGQATLEAEDVTPGKINAAAYNPTDGYLWGSLNTPTQSIVRIGLNYVTEVYTLDGFFSNSPYVGAINSQGQYYVKPGGQDFQIVDLDSNSNSYLTVIEEKTLSQNLSIADWAFNAADDMLYTVTMSGNNELCRIDPNTGSVEVLGEVPILNGLNYSYGAVYFDVDGNFYVSANQTGTIYIISEVQNIVANGNIDSNLFAYGPASASNDGARCPTAPVTKEICDNGIDDDGDGLSDCDDPSCSGVSTCPTITVSSGNNGGLESNNRLSQHIANRNYTRSLNPQPETFGPELTNKKYDVGNLSKQNLNIRDLIPIGILGESSALESSPEDLRDITNAVDVYSVDFEKEGYKAATVLALETEDGVYEHSKFICDRLLGAELNSVSNIFLKDESFIKSIIYREDGTREFVLSFSVRLSEEGCVVESHWNLDKYTPETRYYNFQIWTANIDDLITLSEGILDLVDTHRPIESYTLSPPPYVFVQRARLDGSKLELQLMNNNFSNSLTIEGGMRRTETEDFETVRQEVSLAPYKNQLTIDMGEFFDAGLRLSTDREGIPDDLFVSDGPWGIDASGNNTVVQNYEVTRTDFEVSEDIYPVTRGVQVTATSTDYIAAYRALTPRFQAVDLSAYTTFSFVGQGVGILEVSLIKANESGWENQLHSKVMLQQEAQTYTLSRTDFTDMAGQSGSWEDIKMIVFTSRSESGTVESLSIEVTDLKFEEAVTTSTASVPELSNVLVQPNPASDIVTINIESNRSESVLVQVVNASGLIVKSTLLTNSGKNEIDVSNLASGTYMLQVYSGEETLTQKVVILR